MKSAHYLLTIIFLLIFSLDTTAQDFSKIQYYYQVDSLVTEYSNNKQFEEAINVLKSAETKFPFYQIRIINNLAQLYVTIDQIEKAVDVYEDGQSKGLFFDLRPASGTYLRLLKNERFIKFINEDRKRFIEAQKNAKMEYNVVMPLNYNKNKKYPVFISMHGLSGNALTLERFWKLDKYRDKVILVFLQSSQLVGMNSYGWGYIQRSREDLKKAYESLKENYNIDESMVIVGGMSQGGEIAIDAVLNNVIPIAGFIAMNPAGGMMEGLNLDNVKNAASRNISGSIITGENDYSFARQKLIAELFEKGGIRSQFIVIPKICHQFPANVAERLDSALNFIFEK